MLSARRKEVLGSIGYQPVLFGSLPKSSSGAYLVGKLPTTAGWQPALSRKS